MSGSDDTARWSGLAEGQFFERKSAFERAGGEWRQPERHRPPFVC